MKQKQKQIEPIEVVDEVDNTDYKGKQIQVALAKAREQITHISKESRNEHFKYPYTSGENMMVACRKVLADCGLQIHLKDVEHEEIAGRFVQKCLFFMIHIESGEATPYSFSCPVVGKMDDTATFGTNTGVWKYFLRGLLMLPMGDFDEPCARDATPAEKIAQSVIDNGIISTVQNLYEEMDSEWVEKVQKHFEYTNPTVMTNEQLEIIIERAKKQCMKN